MLATSYCFSHRQGTREAYAQTGPNRRRDLLNSVPVRWARIRKERDWVVPVRGRQSSVSSISLFLLESLGRKAGRLTSRRECLQTQTRALSQGCTRMGSCQAHTHTAPSREPKMEAFKS